VGADFESRGPTTRAILQQVIDHWTVDATARVDCRQHPHPPVVIACAG
jgi:hypothetical protein